MFREWFAKLAWMLISFKLWAFITITGLLVLAWCSAEAGFRNAIVTAQGLFDKGYIDSEQFSEVITHANTVYMDSLLGHVSTFGVGVLVSIVAAKAITDWGGMAKEREIIKRVDKAHLENGGLKKFLPKG